MAAATQDLVREYWSLPQSAPNEIHVQEQNTTIFQGAVGMQVAGLAKPAASGVAGSTLLGVTLRRYVAPAAASNKVYPLDEPMTFQRGVYLFPGLAGDLPTELMINKPVFFADDSTVKGTAAANDLSGILRALVNGMYAVEV